ncbi:PREDICTED: eukaryotic translation initiation factor 2 subunit 2-like, partial [Priapulus caudatus]|uniref:Eukaryotic translation initiation factor 2 subunit 2 n=1 Tax=Priapulus caudatus TaxID=37621 RepID=A0ABM1F1I7_PRICU
LFDPSIKKKKKKKKTPFDLDAAMAGETNAEPVENRTEDRIEAFVVEEELEEKKEEDDFAYDLDDFSGKKKKKKKKAKVLDLDALDGGTAETGEGTAKQDDESLGLSDGTAWSGSDRDYTYEELLTRVFDIMREKNPDMVAGDKKRFVMRPPQVCRVGTKKTSFANFADICKILHRQPKHLLAFLMAELGTSGSVDGNNQLIIKGKFQQKQIENVLRRYIKEYVTCHTCRSPDTILQKDTRLFFLQCEMCGSRCSVASIKSGFQAVTGKRAAIRAKQT